MFATKNVELGGGITAVIRRPAFYIWAEFEDLTNGRYRKPTAAEEQTQRVTRDEAAVRAYMEREGSAPPPEPAKPAEPRTIKIDFTREDSREILRFVESEYIADSLVAIEDGETRYEFIRPDGTKLPPPLDIRDLGPNRTTKIANAITRFVRESRVYSFRLGGPAETEESAGPLALVEGDGPENSGPPA